MTAPINFFTLSLDFWKTATRLGETMVATGDVLASRGRTIDTAMRQPLDADYAELGRMVPEKADAFSRAGLALLTDFWGWQNDAFAQAADIGALAMRGGLPSAKDIARISDRSTRMTARALATGDHALAPIHATVTKNQKRLNRTRKG